MTIEKLEEGAKLQNQIRFHENLIKEIDNHQFLYLIFGKDEEDLFYKIDDQGTIAGIRSTVVNALHVLEKDFDEL